jgi:predicted nucleic acid-binding protein
VHNEASVLLRPRSAEAATRRRGTSVFGGVFDDEFRDYSIQLFDQVNRGEVICVYSNVVVQELQDAPRQVMDYLKSISGIHTEIIEDSPIVNMLANEYIRKNIIGNAHFDDCLHIALATFFNVDAIVSWNFKHIVNDRRIPGYNSVNLNQGYKEIHIFSPKQLITNGTESNGN